MTREERHQLLAAAKYGLHCEEEGYFDCLPMWVPEYDYEADLLRRILDQGVYAIVVEKDMPDYLRYCWISKDEGGEGGSYMQALFPSLYKHETPGAWFIEDILAAYDAKEEQK